MNNPISDSVPFELVKVTDTQQNVD